MTTDEEHHALHPKWKSRYAVAAILVTVCLGAITAFQTLQHVLMLTRNALPLSIARLIPGSEAARFDEGALAVYTNRYLTDAKLEQILGPPASRMRGEGYDALGYDSEYGKLYLERKDQQTRTVTVIAGKRMLPPSMQNLFSSPHVELGNFRIEATDSPENDVIVWMIPEMALVFVSGFNQRVGTYYVGYRFPPVIDCDGAEKAPFLPFRVFKGRIGNCRANKSASASAFSVTTAFDLTDRDDWRTAVERSGQFAPFWDLVQ